MNNKEPVSSAVDDLPSLPNAFYPQWSHSNEFAAYTADQMRDYARAALSRQNAPMSVDEISLSRMIDLLGAIANGEHHGARCANADMLSHDIRKLHALSRQQVAQPVHMAGAQEKFCYECGCKDCNGECMGD